MRGRSFGPDRCGGLSHWLSFQRILAQGCPRGPALEALNGAFRVRLFSDQRRSALREACFFVRERPGVGNIS